MTWGAIPCHAVSIYQALQAAWCIPRFVTHYCIGEIKMEELGFTEAPPCLVFTQTEAMDTLG